MAGNTIGKIFRLTTFGESHGSMIGGIIDGCPSGLKIDTKFIQSQMLRRKAGQYPGSTSRIEEDEVELVSGVLDNYTTGTPIAILIKNKHQNSKDYQNLKGVYRPSHADLTYDKKYGIYDHRGGGRASARETAVRVAAGAIAKLLIKSSGIVINGYVSGIGNVIMPKTPYYDSGSIHSSPVLCPEPDISKSMTSFINELQKKGETAGGIVCCYISGQPVGLGEPVFDKLQSSLAAAMMSIPAAKAFEYGSGFDSSVIKGSDILDTLVANDSEPHYQYTNRSGGILGGISTGQPICIKVVFKAVSSLMNEREGINQKGEKVIIPPGGRHDVCVVPRAVAVVEAMAALVMADHLLRQRCSNL